MPKELHMMIGGIGTGKSTFAQKMSKEQGLNIFSADKIEEENSHLSDKEIVDLLENMFNNQIMSGESFILDGKCLTAGERKNIISKAVANGYTVYGYDFGSGNIVSLLRRMNNPRKFLRDFWEGVYQSDQRNYVEPEVEEGFERIYLPNR